MKKQLEEALQEVCKLELLYIDTLVIQATTHRIYPLICINLTNILKMFFFLICQTVFNVLSKRK